MLTLAAVIAVLSILIFVHELGHLLAAKAVDIEVPRFSIGFGPRIAGFRIGETEYVLSALPLGGYVKMAGMEDDEALEVLEGKGDAEREPSSRDFDSKPLWARSLVIVAGVTMNFLLAILIYAGIAFFSGEQLDPTTRVAVAEPEQLTGAAAPLAEIPFGARLEAIGDHTVESWNDVRRSLFEAPPGPTTLRFADAPPLTLTLPPRDSTRIPVIEALQPLHEPVIGRVEPGYPAEEVGLQPGDRVIAAGGQPIRAWSEMVRVISAHPGRPLPLEIERNGQRISLTVT
ncbi:MAG TPA: RIP metalloprotease RseP, partial [Longimicrobiaceae bacterium]|nr:RIP metalloprotease RseP [Longimicrobiaceae bacterium]